MRVVVIGAGMAGLTAARVIAAEGHDVTVLDKGRRPGGRMATKELGGGASADHGHPRFAVAHGMAELAANMSVGLDVRSSVHVDAVRSAGRQWAVTWPATKRGAAGLIEADVVVLTPPAPQAAALVASEVTIPELAYEPMLSLLVALGDSPSVPSPGGVQLEDDPTWSWIGDNVAKGASTRPAVTLHTRADVAASRWDEDNEALTVDLLRSAEPWVRDAEIIDVRLHRWRYATPLESQPDPCLVKADGRVVFAGDAFGGPGIEGAFLSGRAAADAVVNGNL